jgi:hypothetical protein
MRRSRRNTGKEISTAGGQIRICSKHRTVNTCRKEQSRRGLRTSWEQALIRAEHTRVRTMKFLFLSSFLSFFFFLSFINFFLSFVCVLLSFFHPVRPSSRYHFCSVCYRFWFRTPARRPKVLAEDFMVFSGGRKFIGLKLGMMVSLHMLSSSLIANYSIIRRYIISVPKVMTSTLNAP